MRKIYVIVSLVIFFVLGGFYIYERHSHSLTQDNLNNQIAQNQNTVKEKDDLYSALSIKLDDLRLKNEDLKKIIDNRNEKIEAKGTITIQPKEIDLRPHSTQTHIPASTSPKNPSERNTERLRVSFNQDTEHLSVKGFILTNPAYSELSIKLKPITLNLTLTKTKNKQYRLYIQNKNARTEKIKINLFVDSDSFKPKWYERFRIGGTLSLSDQSALVGANAMYDFGGWSIGPSVNWVIGDRRIDRFIGFNFSYLPF